MSSQETLDQFLQDGTIHLQPGPLLTAAPPPLADSFTFDRIAGMLLGLAIGDSLGNTTEGLLPTERRQAHGLIRDYLPNRYAGGRPVGLPSDDTQMAFWTLEQLLADGELIPDHLAQRFCAQPIFGIGHTVQRFIHAYQDEGQPWYRAGQPSAGNGALMRIAPVLIPHLRQPSPALWADTALAALVTHNDAASTASCLALVRILWEALSMTQAPAPAWWLDTFCATVAQLEGETRYQPRRSAIHYEGPLWQFTQDQVQEAWARDLTVVAACDSWYSGAYLLETVPSVLYILCRHAEDPEMALVRAVNDTKDNDTIAAIVGAVVGALHGAAALPRRWVDGLLGRIGSTDDGRIFELIEQARDR
ncbi:MAG: ADP-ribosylglycohydrolase family protein [Chloroflexi bacterium]|nr:ADP-ribosylglycohydrolase family protein [Chloroflexota bacterium]